jgi:RNA polymerase sigma-70 factor (ECF subfamily)
MDRVTTARDCHVQVVNSVPPDQVPFSEADAEHSRWFIEEVHPHESNLRGYLHGSFPKLNNIDDVVQESFLRVWKARTAHRIQFAKAFLFKVARNVALDSIRRNRTSPIETVGDLTALRVLPDRPDLGAVLREERIDLLAEAIASLPNRRREIVIMRKLKRLSQIEVAIRLGLSERTVENQLFRGMKQCQAYLRACGMPETFSDGR